MWLLPLFPRVAGLATRTFYRTSVSGGEIPREGPLLLVGNHPNSLLDPLFLAAVAQRPVRFLAKAPLFSDPRTSWAVEAVGAIPVYRHRDDPALVRQNASMFRAAHDALRAGAAIGIFPEGMSHDAPSLVPLRTGAARIALGARSLLGHSIPIIPIGLVLLSKEEFRSEAHVMIGEPVTWDDIAGAEESAESVRNLTARIDQALRSVTLNLEKWDDVSLIAAAERISVAEHGAGPEAGTLVDRWQESAHVLSRSRRNGDADAVQLAREVRRHARALALFGLLPEDLNADADLEVAARWSARRLGLPAGLVLASVGAALFWVPYRATGLIVGRAPTDGSGRASVKLVVGAGLFILWIAVLSALAASLGGWKAGLGALLLLPSLAVATLILLEKWSDAWGDARRFFLLRSRRKILDDFRERQTALALRLRSLRERVAREHR